MKKMAVSARCIGTLLIALQSASIKPLSLQQVAEGKHTALALGTCTLAASAAWLWYAHQQKSPKKWNWSQLEKEKKLTSTNLQFPKNFLWGAGSSAQQVEGDCFNNSWFEWERQRANEIAPAGKACNQWDKKQLIADIELMQKMGLKAYRFSIEWSKLEPAQGIFDQDGFEHYEMVCKELVAHGIRPVITLHHYTDPIWFMEKGGFEKEENIHYYVRFCSEIFAQLNKYQPLFLTFNSPASYALNSYYTGTRPPGTKSLQTAMLVLSNMLNAHVAAYKAMKELAGTSPSSIGILHNIFHLELGNRYNPLDHLARKIGNLISHDCVYDFFTTGNFSVHIPGMVKVDAKNETAPYSLDFIGLNYYSHAYMRWFKPTPAADEIATDNPTYTIYAEGLYRAIKKLDRAIVKPIHHLTGKSIPLYVTENGIATTDDKKRKLFFEQTLYALSQACKKFDVRGYIHWAFMDNYEWGNYEKKYGLCTVDFNTQERTIKDGSRHFIDAIRNQ